MIGYKWPVLTAMPPLAKRLEIMQAIQTLSEQIEADRLRRQQAEIAARSRLIERLESTVDELQRHCDLRARSYVLKYDPNKSRVPAGNPEGGEWTDAGIPVEHVGDQPDAEDSDFAPLRVAANRGFERQGFPSGCESGGTYGSSGMYFINGRKLCIDCASKYFGLSDDPPSERVKFLERFLIGR